ncbi:MAG TPA: TSUP family transporter [Sphingobacteriaceae bacterium]
MLTDIKPKPQHLPVFLKPDRLEILVISGRSSSFEINNLIHNLPEATFRICGTADVNKYNTGDKITLLDQAYDARCLNGANLVIIDSDDLQLIGQVRNDALAKGKFIKIIGHPELSNIHLNGVMHPGHSRAAEAEEVNKQQAKRWLKVANWSLFALAFMLLGHAVFSYISFPDVWNEVSGLSGYIDEKFMWMLAAGFVAQLVDGALGMGYGAISTTVLLSTGLNPAAISGSIHTAEMFSSGASGFSHYRFGNVNKKLFRTLLIPGILGAVIGALLLSYLGDKNATWVRPVLSVYTMILGIRIISQAFKKAQVQKKIKRAGWLAGAGGFLDSFGGGGWGPLVTSTLISKGRSPRFVIGTVSLTEFFVTLSSALTFFIMLGVTHIQVIAGLIVGGLLAAPLAARLAGRLPLKTMLISVGVIIIFSSIRILWLFSH